MLCMISLSENIISDPDLGKIGEEKSCRISCTMEDMKGISGPAGVRAKNEYLDGGSASNYKVHPGMKDVLITYYEYFFT